MIERIALRSCVRGGSFAALVRVADDQLTIVSEHDDRRPNVARPDDRIGNPPPLCVDSIREMGARLWAATAAMKSG